MKAISESRLARLVQGMTLDELSQLTQINIPKLSKIERGLVIPRDEEKFLLSVALGKEAKEIFPEV